ncbi:MAG: hypothetical protein HY562_01705 [Ignavibacteriales bacterium]|nr:hypothetical protein [Ignavibacteriales bacterium]
MANNNRLDPIDFTEILIGYEGKWVVISEDNKHVLASADTLDGLGEKVDAGFVMKVPRFDAAYAPTVFPHGSSVH